MESFQFPYNTLPDLDILSTLSAFDNANSSCSSSLLMSEDLFSQSYANDSIIANLMDDDCDIVDVNYLLDTNTTCNNYYSILDFNQQFCCLDKFLLIQINCHSLSKNFTKLELFLSSLKRKPDAISL